MTHTGEALSLRLLVDASLLEVFTGSGEVLSTRVYRGQASPPHAPHALHRQSHAGGPTQIADKAAIGTARSAASHCHESEAHVGSASRRMALQGASSESPCGVDVLSWGGETLVLSLACHEMTSIWE